jgi:hypothetical protein
MEPIESSEPDALSSHPDKFWARQEAQRILIEALSDPEECPMCAGDGCVFEPDVELTEAEKLTLAAAREFAVKARGKAKEHLASLLAIVDRATGDCE